MQISFSMTTEEKDQCLRDRLHAKAEKDGEQNHETAAVSHIEKVKLYKKFNKGKLGMG